MNKTWFINKANKQSVQNVKNSPHLLPQTTEYEEHLIYKYSKLRMKKRPFTYIINQV